MAQHKSGNVCVVLDICENIASIKIFPLKHVFLFSGNSLDCQSGPTPSSNLTGIEVLEKDDEKRKEPKERFNETLLVDNDGLNQDQDASKGLVLAYLANGKNKISYSSFPGGVEPIAEEAE